MKEEVYIKVYGWLEILERNGNCATLRSKTGGKFTYNILGLDVRKTKYVCENVWCSGGKVYINGEQNLCEKCLNNEKKIK